MITFSEKIPIKNEKKKDEKKKFLIQRNSHITEYIYILFLCLIILRI